MTNLKKVLGTLQPVLTDGGVSLKLQIVDAENVLCVMSEGSTQLKIKATITQWQAMFNEMNLWETLPCEKD